jgi:5-deoxy-glucuronate isomerase
MQRHIKAQPGGSGARRWDVVPAGVLRFLEFALLDLPESKLHSGSTGDRECVLDVFSGAASIEVEGNGFQKTFPKVGGRSNVFSGPPSVLYIPPQCAFHIHPASPTFRAGLFFSPATRIGQPALIEGSSIVTRRVGQGNFERTVYTAIGEDLPAERVLAGETLNAPGGWSSFPPHKHDRANPPQEARLEEVYYFQIQPARGFGFIWTYTAEDDPEGFNNVFVVENGDTVLLPKGYHPVVAAPGCQLHYTWVLAGEERRYGAWVEDPKYAALKAPAL